MNNSCRKSDICASHIWHHRNYIEKHYRDRIRHGVWNILHCAVHFECEAVTKHELENGADINEVNSHGNTPLHVAFLRSCRVDIIEILLKHKPLVNMQNLRRDTPLNLCIRLGYSDENLVRTLFEVGADPNIPNDMGDVPLHHLVFYSRTAPEKLQKIAPIFIEYKANINFQNRDGESPLHQAILMECQSYVELLLQHDANIHAENKKKCTPMDLAYAKRIKFPGIFHNLGKRAIILDSCKIPMKPEHLAETRKTESLKVFWTECEQELNKLKAVKLGESFVTLYRILTSTTQVLSKYLRNQDIVKALKDTDTAVYGIFGKRLDHHILEGMERMKALDSGYPVCRQVFQGISEVLLDGITAELGNEDLLNVKRAYLKRKNSSE